MKQLVLFDEMLPEEIKKQVISEFPRIDGEDYEEWLEVIQVEFQYRMKEAQKNKPKPDYSNQNVKFKDVNLRGFAK